MRLRISAAYAIILLSTALPVRAESLILQEGQILISRDYSNELVVYDTGKSEVRLQRDYATGSDGSQYLVEYSVSGQRKTSYRFDVTPKVEAFDIVDIDVTRKFCNREMAIVTVREYTNIEGPNYSYSRIFLELTQPGKGFDYQDTAATSIGGPTPLGLLEDYATIDCDTMPVELTDKSQ
ncbi:hypothetical protein BJF91_19135 [Allorhizobium taibaishanense]|nr:hypothetical protein BJF91_19135 [Allorhizobium taibaishanense]